MLFFGFCLYDSITHEECIKSYYTKEEMLKKADNYSQYKNYTITDYLVSFTREEIENYF